MVGWVTRTTYYFLLILALNILVQICAPIVQLKLCEFRGNGYEIYF